MTHRLLAGCAAALLLVSCGDDDEKAEAKPTCEELGEACHDSETELGMGCHEFGHDESSTEAECKARRTECLAECG